ncbi:AzlD domain-containing protein [Thalassotalea castellviae]|uniref:AzlD domain-containing protein n=1 Tax=Thalassotalea castellviae TaxID=3075612 RepID=A0ABU2ZYL0_9GAMM|nr:AzlD domain-containing protein [Thalassotalea sp. W431]MDT0602432.1 AzlD domain-containing protein [Thalassotalea sp. W431]
MTLVTILLMAMITFLTRYLFIHPKIPLRLNAKVVSFLSFSAPAVLTAIWVPIIFIREGELALSLTNPYIIAATVAVLLASKKVNIYLILLTSGALFITLKMLY